MRRSSSSLDTWVFNPKLNQVIKLPPSMMAQSWMGSDFSYNDLAKSEDILTDYTHRIIATDTESGHRVTTIEAVPKPGAPVVWGKIDLKLRDDDVVIEETFFDQDMKAARKMRDGESRAYRRPAISARHDDVSAGRAWPMDPYRDAAGTI